MSAHLFHFYLTNYPLSQTWVYYKSLDDTSAVFVCKLSNLLNWFEDTNRLNEEAVHIKQNRT